jgi:hypothetical protein
LYTFLPGTAAGLPDKLTVRDFPSLPDRKTFVISKRFEIISETFPIEKLKLYYTIIEFWLIGLFATAYSGRLAFAITDSINFELAGVALATVSGIMLNLIFPVSRSTIKTD